MAERMTEEKVAALQAEFRRAEREDQARREQVSQAPSARLRMALLGGANEELHQKERAYLEAAAQLQRERREEADAATAEVVSANRDMAAASKEAARYSADSALASQRSARWTLVAAVVAAAGVLVQAWQACRAVPPHPQPPPAAAAPAPRP